MRFIVANEEFTIVELIDNKIDNAEVQRLINTVKLYDDSYIVEEPLSEDIIIPQDNWSCHIAKNIGLTFEFIEGQLCYISFFLDLNPAMSTIISDNNEIIIGLIKNEEKGITDVSFGSSKLIVEAELYPNRWSQIIESFFPLY